MKTRIEKAIKLLKDDNLVWSNDFNQIRKPLAELLDVATQWEYHHIESQLDTLLDSLLSEKKLGNDWTEEDGNLIIENPIDEFQDSARQQLYIIEALAKNSKSMNKALNKLFRNL
jgi:hypothetical protein